MKDPGGARALSEAVRRGEVAAPIAAEVAVDRFVSLDPDLAWAIDARRGALEEAQRASGPLAGVTVLAKDVFADGGRAPTCGSRIGAEWLTGTAGVLRRLRARGAVVVGYTNLHEWCLGTTSTVSARGPIKNPRDPERIAGGSSGGSAACVAAGIVPVALGSDAGGSIRVPAACCGVVGLKPSVGALPTRGFTGDGCSVDHVGPLGRTVDDVALVMEALTSRPAEPPDAGALRVGVARRHFFDALESPLEAAVEETIAALGAWVAEVSEVEVEGAEGARRALSTLFVPFVARGLERALGAIPESLQPETLRTLRRAGSPGEARAREAVAARARVVEGWRRAFERVDVVLTPTIAEAPPRLDAAPDALLAAQRSHLALNAPMSLAGVPALSLPCGDLGASVTLSAPRGNDHVVLALGKALEEERGASLPQTDVPAGGDPPRGSSP